MEGRSPIESWLRRRLSRRAVLAGGLALCGLPHARAYAARPRSAWRWAATPFALGVASGEPAPESVVLWTRLAPDPLDPGGGMPPEPVAVEWEIATDDRFSSVVRRGAIYARPEMAHSVHVEIEGLPPDRWFWYRFRAAGEISPAGRTRTAPLAGASPSRFRFAFASCQHYEQGYFTAYEHLVADDPDLVLHLGDYIYEGAGRDGRVRKHAGDEITTLDDYRRRYAQYRTDPHLQAAHAAAPWIVTWDDHEVDNNYAADLSEQLDPRDLFLLRRAAAYQAYYEHMPLRRTAMAHGPSLQLYRQSGWGDLAAFFVLDTRQYRSDQPCGDGSKAPCPEVGDPDATLLGADQERWLFDGLDQSRAVWNVLPQQIMMARVDLQPDEGERYSMDQWSGYDAARNRLIDFFATRRPANPIVLTGDIHSNWANDLKRDFRDPDSPTVATELVCTSISSGGDGTPGEARFQTLARENPFVRFYNGQRGYVLCDVDRRRLQADYRVMSGVTTPDGSISTAARFRIETGSPGLIR